MNKNSKKVISTMLVLSMLAPNAVTGVNALDSKENPGVQDTSIVYKDGTYTGYGNGFKANNGLRQIRMDVTIKDGNITDIRYTPDETGENGYHYPDDKGASGGTDYQTRGSNIIDVIKSTKNPYKVSKDLTDYLNIPEDDRGGIRSVDGGRYRLVSGATFSARGVAQAVVDALEKSKKAAIQEKVINSISVINGPNKNPFKGDTLDLTSFRINVSYSDRSSEEIGFSDLGSKGYKIYVQIDNNPRELVTGNTYTVTKGTKKYSFIIEKDGTNSHGSYNVITKNKTLFEKNLFYKIGDGEYKEVTPLKMYPKDKDKNNPKIDSNQYIQIDKSDIGKTITFKTDKYYNLYDDEVVNTEYVYSPVVLTNEILEEGYFEIAKKGDNNSQDGNNNSQDDNVYDSGSLFINISLREDSSDGEGNNSDSNSDSGANGNADSGNNTSSENGDSNNGSNTDSSTGEGTSTGDGRDTNAEIPVDDSISLVTFKYSPYYHGQYFKPEGIFNNENNELKSPLVIKEPSSLYEKFKLELTYMENGESKTVEKEVKKIPEGTILFDLENGKKTGVKIKFFRPILKKLQYAVVDNFESEPDESSYIDIELPEETFFDVENENDTKIYRKDITLDSSAVGKYIKYKYEFVYPNDTVLDMYTTNSLASADASKIYNNNDKKNNKIVGVHGKSNNVTNNYDIRFVIKNSGETSNANTSDKEIKAMNIVVDDKAVAYLGQDFDISNVKVKVYYKDETDPEILPYSQLQSRGVKAYIVKSDATEPIEGNSIHINDDKNISIVMKKGEIASDKYTIKKIKYRTLFEKDLLYSIDNGEYKSIPEFKLQELSKGEIGKKPENIQVIPLKKSDIGKRIKFKTTKYIDVVDGSEYDYVYESEPIEITQEMFDEAGFSVSKKGRADIGVKLENKKFDNAQFLMDINVIEETDNRDNTNTDTSGTTGSSEENRDNANTDATGTTGRSEENRDNANTDATGTTGRSEENRDNTNTDTSGTTDKSKTDNKVTNASSKPEISPRTYTYGGGSYGNPTSNKEENKVEQKVDEVLQDSFDARKDIISEAVVKKVLKNATKVETKNIYDTAVEVSRKVFKKADTVIIANGDSTDVLSAIPLSNLKNAPILFVKKDSTPKSVKDEINRLGATNIITIGGGNTISKSLDILNNKMFKVTNISGSDRYETSKLIADEVMKLNGGNKNAVLVNLDNPVDAISLSSVKSLRNSPVLLTRSDKMDKSTHEFFNKNNIGNVSIFGGSNSVSSEIEKELGKKTSVKRYSGRNRYETSINIAKASEGCKEIVIVNGKNYKSGLSVSSYANKKDALVVVVENPKEIKPLINLMKKLGIEKATIIGKK